MPLLFRTTLTQSLHPMLVSFLASTQIANKCLVSVHPALPLCLLPKWRPSKLETSAATFLLGVPSRLSLPESSVKRAPFLPVGRFA